MSAFGQIGREEPRGDLERVYEVRCACCAAERTLHVANTLQAEEILREHGWTRERRTGSGKRKLWACPAHARPAS